MKSQKKAKKSDMKSDSLISLLQNKYAVSMLSMVAIAFIFSVLLVYSPSNYNYDSSKNSVLNSVVIKTAVPSSAVTESSVRASSNDIIGQATGTCRDSDGGTKVQEKGTVTKGSDTKTDYCLNKEYVKEYYCTASGNVASIGIMCGTGKDCDDGACKTAKKCTDTDSGKDYYKKGTAHYIAPNIDDTDVDTCVDKNQLSEHYCDGDKPTKNVLYTCPNGCSNGACLSATCVDSDNGINYNSKGNTRYTIAGQNTDVDEDTCIDTTRLSEQYCDGDSPNKQSVYTCPNGCSNGACLSNAYCYDSDNGLNYNIKGNITISGQQTTTNLAYDFCYNTTTVAEYYCNSNHGASSFYTCPNGCSNGACISNSQSFSCSDNGSTNYFQRGSVSVMIGSTTSTYTDYCGTGTLNNTVYEHHCLASASERGTGNRIGYDITSRYCEQGCLNGACISAPECTDSDFGLNYSFKGTATFRNSTNTVLLDDTCVNQTIVIESYCTSSNRLGQQSYRCPYACYDGACFTANNGRNNLNNQPCTDSDGNNVYEKGIVRANGYIYSDGCIGSTHVKEYICKNGQVDTKQYRCDGGCVRGKCSR